MTQHHILNNLPDDTASHPKQLAWWHSITS